MTIKEEKMINNLNENLSGMAIGIRFRPNFLIEDKFGELIDNILYPKNSFFNPTAFPEVETTHGTKTLFNQKTEDKITIAAENIILEINFTEESEYKKDQIDVIINNFNTQILRGVLEKFKIESIIRIGIVRKLKVADEELREKFIEKVVGKKANGIKEASLRFSKALAIGKSILNKDINDYDNVIYIAALKKDANELLLNLDYQRYFIPFLSTIGQIDYKDFIAKAEKYGSEKFVSWINNSFIED